jgi:glycosyltransferase involved in cell wall biosynthesis
MNRIGFVSTRLAGTDGVSLEVRKWVDVLRGLEQECFFFAGESEWAEEQSYVVREAHFEHPEISTLNGDLFDDYIRSPETTARIEKLKNHLKKHLYKFVKRYSINLLIIENAMAIPMNVPLGLALTELVAETGLPTIGHHHDFAWERSRFSVSAADDYLNAAFPATLSSMIHVTINSHAQRQLALRTGASSLVVPNVMDFDSPPPEPDGYGDDMRQSLEIDSENYLLLQPTRIVPRKRIELAITLAKRINLPVTVLISHGGKDEGLDYEKYLHELAGTLDVDVRFAAGHFALNRGKNKDGCKIYSLGDAYLESDLVTYPSTIEGFGNAFLEAVYFRKPIVMSTYEIYLIDIKPKGFEVVEFDNFITQETVEKMRRLLLEPDLSAELCDRNYNIARKHYSFTNLEKYLVVLLNISRGDL